MLSRLLWRIVTPRQLRRAALAALVLWLGLSYLHHNGTVDRLREDIPRQVQVTVPTHLRESFPNYR